METPQRIGSRLPSGQQPHAMSAVTADMMILKKTGPGS
jgi:hypothetical protein